MRNSIGRPLPQTASLVLSAALTLVALGCTDTAAPDKEADDGNTLLNAGPSIAAAQVNGGAFDVGVSAGGSVAVVGTTNAIFQWMGGNSWNGAYGGWATSVALDRWGNIYVISGGNTIFRWTAATGWQQLPGYGYDISVGGPNDDVWLVGTDRQLWHMDNYYTFTGKQSARCLDIADISGANGAKAQLWDCSDGANQKFKVVPVGDGWVNLVAAHSGKCLDVAGNSPFDGAQLQQWDCVGGENQKFRLQDQGGGSYALVAKNSLKCVEVGGFNTANGAGVNQWLCTGGINQAWTVKSSVGWTPAGGGNIQRVAVDSNGTPWIVAGDTGIVQLVPGQGFQFRNGYGFDVGAGISGVVYVVGTDRNLYRWNGSSWDGNSALGGNVATVAVDSNGMPWWTKTDNTIWHGVSGSNDLQAPFLTPAQQSALACKWADGGNGTYNVTCTSSQGGPGLTLTGATGAITSPSNYTLKATANDMAAMLSMVPGVQGLLDFLNGNVVSGLSGATLTLYGPDNGNKAVIDATVGFGSYFQPIDDSISGLTGGKVTLMADKFPIQATLQNGVVAAQVQLLPTNAHPGVEYTEPTTGIYVGVDSIVINYLSNPKTMKASVAGKFKLSASDPTANVTIVYTSKSWVDSNNKEQVEVTVSGTLQNLIKPFGGLVPISLTSGTFAAVQGASDKGKPVMKKIAVSIDKGILFDNLELGGNFLFDKTVSPAQLQFSLSYKVCGQWNSLAFNSTDLNAIPQQMFNVVSNFGKSINSCFANSTCKAGYTKVWGTQCDKTCPDYFSNSSPGLCTHTTQQCPNGTTGYVWPNCKSMSNSDGSKWCGTGATLADGILGKNDLCVYKCENWGLTGSLPSCVNPDQANTKAWTWP